MSYAIPLRHTVNSLSQAELKGLGALLFEEGEVVESLIGSMVTK